MLTGKSGRFWFVSLSIVALIAALASYAISLRVLERQAVSEAVDRATFYRSTLVNALRQHDHLPFILASDPAIQAGARGQGLAGLNGRLERFATAAGLEALYLMQPDGLTIASSNHAADVTFLGQNYGFRPYFISALAGQTGRMFAVGATTKRAGYFVAEPVRSETGDIIAVLALKLDLSPLKQDWVSGGERVFATNEDGVVVLSSEDSWLYRTLAPLSPSQRDTIMAQKQFADARLAPLDVGQSQASRMTMDGDDFLSSTLDVEGTGWQLHYLKPRTGYQSQAAMVALILGGLLALALAWGYFIRSERIRNALENSQKDRSNLRKSNALLEQEIEDRRAAETRLAKAQEELEQVSRLAALGYLSASVTHELGQPISALQTYIAAAEIDPEGEDIPQFVKKLSDVADRMERTTSQLRFFARPGATEVETLDVCDVVNASVELLRGQMDQQEVQFDLELPTTAVQLRGNRLRLEQVVINVLRNALNAVEDEPEPKVVLRVDTTSDDLAIIVSDNGSGIEQQNLEKIFEPFQTTRSSGDGMGLGLSISTAIVKEHGGRILAENAKTGGAVFRIELPHAAAAEAA